MKKIIHIVAALLLGFITFVAIMGFIYWLDCPIPMWVQQILSAYICLAWYVDIGRWIDGE